LTRFGAYAILYRFADRSPARGWATARKGANPERPVVRAPAIRMVRWLPHAAIRAGIGAESNVDWAAGIA